MTYGSRGALRSGLYQQKPPVMLSINRTYPAIGLVGNDTPCVPHRLPQCTIVEHLAGEEVVEVTVQGRRGALVFGDVLHYRRVGHLLVHVRVSLRQEIEPFVCVERRGCVRSRSVSSVWFTSPDKQMTFGKRYEEKYGYRCLIAQYPLPHTSSAQRRRCSTST